MCALPGEAGSVEYVNNVNIKDFTGEWYDVLIDKNAWGGEEKNPTCTKSTIGEILGSQELVSGETSLSSLNKNDAAPGVVHDQKEQGSKASLNRKDFKSQEEGFNKFLIP